MFDVGFSELIVIAVLALVVIGPERLPAVARTVGAMLGRAQRYFNSVKAEVNRELQLDELKRIQQETYERVMAMEAEVHHGLAQVEHAAHDTVAEVKETVAVADAPADVSSAAAPVAAVAEPAPAAAKTVPILAPEALDAPAATAVDSGQADLFASPPETLDRLAQRQTAER